MTEGGKRTQLAQAAMDTSQLMNLRFASRIVGTNTPRRLMVTVPDGPSTEGGRKARQSIVLAPVSDASAGSLVCGFIDLAQKRAELRVHDVVKSQFESRYKIPFDIPKDAYHALLRDVRAVLDMQGIAVTVVESVPKGLDKESRATLASVEPASPETSPMAIALYVAAFALLVLVAVGAYFALR